MAIRPVKCELCGRQVHAHTIGRHRAVCAKRPRRDEMARLIAAGMLQRHLADELGVSPFVLRGWALEYGLEWPTRSGRRYGVSECLEGATGLLVRLFEQAWADVESNNGHFQDAVDFLRSDYAVHLAEMASGISPEAYFEGVEARLEAVAGATIE